MLEWMEMEGRKVSHGLVISFCSRLALFVGISVRLAAWVRYRHSPYTSPYSC